MSSPTRQVSVRRLPPLPNQGTIRGALKDSGVHFISSDGLNNSASLTSAGLDLKPKSSKVLNDLKVKEYLMSNLQILEEVVMEMVSQEQLERWLIRKTQSQCTYSSDGSDDENFTKPSLSRWKFCVHTDKRKMLQQLTRDINQQPKKARVMYELVRNIAAATHADRYSLYLVDKTGTDIYLYSETKPSNCRNICRQAIGAGSIVAAFVASTGERLHIKDILGDERFPKGIGIEDSTAQSVLCQPIFQSDGTLIGVVELVKSLGSSPFEAEDEEIMTSYLVWGSIVIHHAETCKQMQKQKDLNTFLLNVVRSIFDEVNTMDVVIEKIMAFAKKLVNADRCSLFLVDSKTNELYANLFDEGEDENREYRFRNGKEIRFPMDKGIAGYVATTGEIVNIKDAYRDSRFNREVDLRTGYTTRTILCVPVRSKGRVIGVVQMVNSKTGLFSNEDMHSFEMFAGYCGLALHYSQMYSELSQAQKKHQIALEVLSYHCVATDKEVDACADAAQETVLPEDFYSFFSNVYQTDDVLLNYFIKMSQDVFADCEMRVCPDIITRFSLTVRRNYRDIAYHNWAHAFSVAHSLYSIMRVCKGRFTKNEKLAMFIGGVCHDIDHRGRSNAFMITCNTPLGNLYTSSTMEWHHFNQAVFILEREGHNIFSKLSSEDYREILELIQEAILATDLALFFGNKAKLDKTIDNNTFSWNNPEHRKLVRCLLMTGSDLCTSAKPWPVHRESVKKVFAEFYQQGDEEKSLGQLPLPMMDRTKKNELPQNQVGFIMGIVRPCFTTLNKLLPGMKPILDQIDSNMKQWQSYITKKETIDSLRAPQGEVVQKSLSFIDY